MKFKVVAFIVFGLLLTSCSGTKTEVNDFESLYDSALAKTENHTNYTLTSTTKYGITGVGEKMNLTSSTVVRVNENDDHQELHSEGQYLISGNGLSESFDTVFWYKDGMMYMEGGLSDVNQKFEIDYAKAKEESYIGLLDAELGEIVIDGPVTVKKSDGKDTYSFKLGKDYALKLVYDDYMSELESENSVKASMKVTIKDDFIIGRELKLDVTNVADSSVTTYTSIQTWDNFNETMIEFPSNLDEYVEYSSEYLVSDDYDSNIENLKATLSEGMGYSISNENNQIYSYDWGTETYSFNFEENTFSLITEIDTYTYHWDTQIVYSLNTECTYNIDTEESNSCDDEVLENLKLTEEVFIGEIYYSGIDSYDLQSD